MKTAKTVATEPRFSCAGRNVLVTGAAGTLGSEICRQLASQGAAELVLLDHSEKMLSRLLKSFDDHVRENGTPVRVCLASVLDREAMCDVFSSYSIDTVIHAAAYKHVDLVEQNAANGIRNNLNGTWIAAELAAKASVKDFLMLSTDKACNPVSVMGASKRAGELCMQYMASVYRKTRFFAIRFCNIYGSSDSVVPVFRQQIADGGPITITDPKASRFFLECDHAVRLMLASFRYATSGDVLTITDGVRMEIVKLANKLAMELGQTLDHDRIGSGLPVVQTGLRPGEKLHEELYDPDRVANTDHPAMLRSIHRVTDTAILGQCLRNIIRYADDMDALSAVRLLSQLIPEFEPAAAWKRAAGDASHLG